VFRGVIFDVYQWQQRMFDGTEATFERLRRPDTVRILAIRDNKIVMTHDVQPGRAVRFGIPGGRVDKTDKSWLAAAQRELLEETGLRFKKWKLVHVVQPQHKIEWFGVTFLAWDFESQDAPRHDAGERITLELATFEVAHNILKQDAFALPLAGVVSLQALFDMPEFRGQLVER
jgi:8-oxo-dGTP pyrophosphatase MutT (NUDIX family)